MVRVPGERAPEGGRDPVEHLTRLAHEGRRRKTEAEEAGLTAWPPIGPATGGVRRLLRSLLLSRAVLLVLLGVDVLALAAFETGLHQGMWVGAPATLITLVAVAMQRDAQRPLARAPRWLSRAPFRVHSYPALLHDLPADACVVVMRVVLAPGDPAPPPGLVGDVVGSIDPASRAPFKDALQQMVRSGTLRCAAEPGEQAGVAVERWVKAVVERALTPIHAVHPIVDVFLNREDGGRG